MCVLDMKLLASAVQKLQPEQIHRHANTQAGLKLLPACIRGW